MLTKDLLIIDVETTGLDPESDSLVQLAALVLDHKTLEERDSFSMLVRPDSPISTSAQAIHGRSKKDLMHANGTCTVLKEFDHFAPRDALLSGHNVSFDIAFLKAGYARCGIYFPFDYHTVDIWSIAFFVLGAVGITLESYNLTQLSSFFGIQRSTNHDALEDVRISSQIIRYLFSTISHSYTDLRRQLKIFLDKK